MPAGVFISEIIDPNSTASIFNKETIKMDQAATFIYQIQKSGILYINDERATGLITKVTRSNDSI